MTREKLPMRRECETFETAARNCLLTITLGRVGEEIAEVFLDAEKSDAEVGRDLRDIGILISMLLQHGAELSALAASMTRDFEGKPLGLAGAALDAVLEAAT